MNLKLNIEVDFSFLENLLFVFKENPPLSNENLIHLSILGAQEYN